MTRERYQTFQITVCEGHNIIPAIQVIRDERPTNRAWRRHTESPYMHRDYERERYTKEQAQQVADWLNGQDQPLPRTVDGSVIPA